MVASPGAVALGKPSLHCPRLNASRAIWCHTTLATASTRTRFFIGSAVQPSANTKECRRTGFIGRCSGTFDGVGTCRAAMKYACCLKCPLGRCRWHVLSLSLPCCIVQCRVQLLQEPSWSRKCGCASRHLTVVITVSPVTVLHLRGTWDCPYRQLLYAVNILYKTHERLSLRSQLAHNSY